MFSLGKTTPKFTDTHMSRDLLTSLDPDIIDVEYNRGGGYLHIRLAFGEYITISEQDLTTLQRFLQDNRSKK